MSGTLLVTESTRSYGEFRRSWVRAAFERYVRRYRRRLVRAVEAERVRGPVHAATRAPAAGRPRLPTGVSVRYYDEESYKVDSRALGDSTARLVADSWPSAESAPELSHRGVWLPDLLTISRSIVLRMEIVEPLGILEHVIGEVGPDRVVVLSGASMPDGWRDWWPDDAACRVGRRRPGWSSRAFSRPPFGGCIARGTGAAPRAHRFPPRAVAWRCVRHGACAVRHVPSSHHAVVDPLLSPSGPRLSRASWSPRPPEPAFGRSLERLRASGFPAAFLTDYLSSEESRAMVRRYRPVLAKTWSRLKRDPDLSRRLTIDGVPLADVVRPFLRDSITRGLLSALLGQEAAFRALDATRPTAVLITSTRRLAERALAFAAEQRGFPRPLFGALMLGETSIVLHVADGAVIGDIQETAGDTRRSSRSGSRSSVIHGPAARLVTEGRAAPCRLRQFGLDPARPVLVFA